MNEFFLAHLCNRLDSLGDRVRHQDWLEDVCHPVPSCTHLFTIISDGKRARSWRQTSLKILLAECRAKVPRQAAALAKEVEPMLESRREMVRKVYSPCSNLERGTCDKWKFLMPKANR